MIQNCRVETRLLQDLDEGWCREKRRFEPDEMFRKREATPSHCRRIEITNDDDPSGSKDTVDLLSNGP